MDTSHADEHLMWADDLGIVIEIHLLNVLQETVILSILTPSMLKCFDYI